MARPTVHQSNCSGFKKGKKQVKCWGTRHRIYDRVGKTWRPIGWICNLCLTVTLDRTFEGEDNEGRFIAARYSESKRVKELQSLQGFKTH